MARRDFTLSLYGKLLRSLRASEYGLCSFGEYLSGKQGMRCVILRHDVDRSPHNALKMARMEHEISAVASFYFRMVPESYNEAVIAEIAGMGHEIGYHYEDLAMAKGDYGRAVETFRENIDRLRRFYPVRTICMHGSPLSKWDNRLLWKRHDYRDFDVLGEPYLDLNFDRILYVTDTGRSWNNLRCSVRDKVASGYDYQFRSTFDLIAAVREGLLPEQIMINVHPHRWNNEYGKWVLELVGQNAKNVVKRMLVQTIYRKKQ